MPLKLSLIALLLSLTVSLASAAPSQTFRLKDYLNHNWSQELISYPLSAELRSAPALIVTDDLGEVLPHQVAEERIYLLVDLPALTERSFTVTAGRRTVRQRPAASARVEGDYLLLDAGVMSLRMPAGERQFRPAQAPEKTEGPLCGVRAGEGEWVGRSWLAAPLQVTGYKTTIAASGPLFAEATVDYSFEGGKHYRCSVRVIAGQPTAIVDESMDLNPGGRYKLLSYQNDAERATWDWWTLDGTDQLNVDTRANIHPANAVFSFKDGLEPNQCRWRGARASFPRKGVMADGNPDWTFWSKGDIEVYAPLTYEQDEQFNRIAGWWVNSFPDYSSYFTILNDQRPGTPAISFTGGRPSRNQNPSYEIPTDPWVKMITGVNDLRIWTRTDGDLQVLAPIVLGTRQWLLTVQPQEELRPKGDPEMPTAYTALVKYGYYPLEKIKEWDFDFEEKPGSYPRMFCTPGDLAGMRARVAAGTPEMQAHGNLPAIYRPEGTAEALAADLTRRLDYYTPGTWEASRAELTNWFRISLATIQWMPTWEAAMATPDLDPTVRARIKAWGVFWMERAWDDDFWPPKEYANGWGSINMGTLAGTARVLTAAAAGDYPKGAQWRRRSTGYLLGNLDPLIAEDGSGISCPWYLGASIEPVLYMALALKYGGGYDAFRDNERLRRFGQFMMDIIMPPDPRSPIAGAPAGTYRRNLWQLGDTSRTAVNGIVPYLTLGYAGVDDRLAGAARRMAEWMNYPPGGGLLPAAIISDLTIEPIAPDLRSRWYPGYCAILRDGQPQETWVGYRQTKYAVDHFHADQGSFSLFARGVPLVMDWGSMYSPGMPQVIFHNRLAFDVQEGEPRPCPGDGGPGCYYQGLQHFPHQVEPWTAKTEYFGPGLGPQDSFGEVRQVAFLPTADYVQGRSDISYLANEPYYPTEALALAPVTAPHFAKCDPFSWERRLLLAKAQEDQDPTWLLVRDDLLGPAPAPTCSFWIMADALTFEGNQAHATGQFGVDLDVYVAQPAAPRFGQWQFEHHNEGGEKQLALRITQDEPRPFLNLLYPRQAGDPAATFTTIAAGNGVKITVPGEPGYTDYAFLAPAPVAFEEGDVRFRGTAGYLRLRGSQAFGYEALVALTQPGEATALGTTLVATQPLSAQIQMSRIRLSTNGPAQMVRLSGERPAAMRVTLDGQPLAVMLEGETCLLAIPAGEHELLILGR